MPRKPQVIKKASELTYAQLVAEEGAQIGKHPDVKNKERLAERAAFKSPLVRKESGGRNYRFTQAGEAPSTATASKGFSASRFARPDLFTRGGTRLARRTALMPSGLVNPGLAVTTQPGKYSQRDRDANLDFWRNTFKGFSRNDGNSTFVDPSVIARRSESRKKRLKSDAGRKFNPGASPSQGPVQTSSLSATVL